MKQNFEYSPQFDSLQSESPKPHWPRHWEIVFSTDNTDVYARQLDFFDIELGMLMPDNKIVYAFHLSKPKPDTRVLKNPAANEKRYYLTWRNSESQQADRELLKRGGIDAGNRLVLKFVSQALEAQLSALERNYGGVPAREIAKTRFGVRATGKDFSFYVLEQSLKENATRQK